MAKQGRISMTTADGKFNFTPNRKKGKYCVVRIYSNEFKLDNHLPLKDNTKQLNPLPSCHSEGDYLKQYHSQFAFAMNRLNEVYLANPDAFIRYDKKKDKRSIDTKMLSALVYDNKAKSKSRNELEILPIRKEVAGKPIRTVGNISIVETELKTVDFTEVEKSKIKEAEKINKYFGIENTPENIIKEVRTRKKVEEAKAEIERRNKKYGDYALIVDDKKIKEIFREGDFDQTDLYLLCCAVVNQEKNAVKFSSLLHRFREYNLRNNTALRAREFSVEGVQKFVLYFIQNKICDFSVQGMTPFNYRNEKFIERMNNGTYIVPTDETWRKFFIYLKLLLKLLNKNDELKDISWKTDGLQRLDQINELTDEENYDIKYSSLSSNTRQNFHLNKDEFDKIFKLKLKDAKKTKNHSVSGYEYEVGYTKEELTLTRDQFILMTWLGGLRPIEYSPEKISVLKNPKGEYYVNFITSDKNKKEVANPVLNYAYDVLKKYKFEIPYTKMDSLEFKKRLQVILQQAGIDREIDKIESRSGKHKKIKVNIQDAIYPYFARHTFIQILTDAGLHENQIVRFTGQAFPNVSIEAYSTKGIKVKADWIKHIKPE